MFYSDLRVDSVKSRYKALVMNIYIIMSQISDFTLIKIDHLSIYCKQYVSAL